MTKIIIIIICIILLVLLWVMLYDTNRFVVEHHSFRNPYIRKKCRAVILADLHNKSYGYKNEKLIEAIRRQKPDIILVTGDLPTVRPKEKIDVPVHLIEILSKEFPIYYANGNHEQRMKLYPEKYKEMQEKYDQALEDNHVIRLVNTHVVMDEYGVVIYGVEIDKYFFTRFGVKPMDDMYLARVLGEPKEGYYHLLLAHNPDYFPQYVGWGADLVLSGHVHGGIVRIPFLNRGVASPNVRLFPKYDSGIFHKGKSTMWLSRGLGMHTIPIRIFNPGELMVLDLEPEER